MTRATTARPGRGPAACAVQGRYVVGVVALGLLSAIVGFAAWAVLPALAPGWGTSAITSDSMGPMIRTGDVLVTAPADPAALEPSDVVVFSDAQGQGSIAHRIVQAHDDGTFTTRGDANGLPDSTPLDPERIEGVGRLAVPLVGFPALWLGEAAWGPLAFAVALLFLIGVASRFALLDRFDPWLSPPPVDPGPPAPDAQHTPTAEVLAPPTPQAPSAPVAEPPPPMPAPAPVPAAASTAVATAVPRLQGRLWVAHPYRRRPRMLRATSALTSALLVVALTGGTATARFTDTATAAGSWVAGSWAQQAEDLVYYLKADGEGDQDAQLMLPMATQEPTQTNLPDYSLNLGDGRPGRLLVQGGGDPEGIQAWALEATEETVLHGEFDLTIWAEIFGGDSDAVAGELEIGAFDCPDLTNVDTCEPLGDAHVEGFVTVGDDPWGPQPGFIEVTASFGSVEHTLEQGHHLGVAVMVGDGSGADLSLAYDTVDHPSRLTIDPAPAPATPADLAVTGTGASTVDLAWGAVDDADAYRVRHREAGTSTWTETDTVGGTAMTVDGLAGATTYELQVRAEHLSGASAWSSGVSAATSTGSTVQLVDGGPAGVVGPGMDFHAYVRSDGTAVSSDVSSVVAGAADVPLDAGSWDVDGVTYTHRSATLTADEPLDAGEHVYTVTVDDHDPEAFTLMVDPDAAVQPASDLTAAEGCTTLPIVHRSTSELAQGDQNSNRLQVAAPAGVAEGDVLLAAFATKQSVNVTGVPEGWQHLRTDGQQHVYHRVAGDAEPASYTWEVSAGTRAAGAVVAYEGVDPADPIDAHAGQVATGTTLTAPGVTTSVDDARLVTLFGFNHRDPLTLPGDMDIRWHLQDGGGQGPGHGLRAAGLDEQLGAAGASGDRLAQAPHGDGWMAAQVALRPAGHLDGHARVEVTWEPTPSTFADGYVLERWGGDGLEASRELTGPDTAGFTDHPLPAGTSYTYRLRAVAGDWESDEIETAATTPACDPAG